MVAKPLDTTTLEVDAERTRCVDMIRALVCDWRHAAARIRKDGTYVVSDLYFTRPFWRRTACVRPRYEDYARHITECADALQKYSNAIEGGATLKKEWVPPEHDAGVPTDATGS